MKDNKKIISNTQKANHFIANINSLITHFIDEEDEEICYLTVYNNFWNIPDGIYDPIEIIKHNTDKINEYLETTMYIMSHEEYIPFCIKAYLINIKTLALELMLSDINIACIKFKHK